jgi:hypothetical protein
MLPSQEIQRGLKTMSVVIMDLYSTHSPTEMARLGFNIGHPNVTMKLYNLLVT